MKWLFLVGLVFINACTSIDSVKRVADDVSEVVLAGTCAMTLGSYYRLENPNHKAGATLICNPNAKAPITKKDVMNLLEGQ